MEKRTVIIAGQEIPYLYGIQKFTTVLTEACHRILSWARWIQFTRLHPFHNIPFIRKSTRV
jgi:hypothetical protein